jgi:hypothetical protein
MVQTFYRNILLSSTGRVVVRVIMDYHVIFIAILLCALNVIIL